MFKVFKSSIAASVIAVAIATAGITTVSSFTFVPEAQAWSIKKAVKKTTRVIKRKAKIVKDLNWKDAKDAYSYGSFKEAYVAMGKGAYKHTKRAVKRADSHIAEATGSYARCLKNSNCGKIGKLPPGTAGFNTHDHRS